MEQLLTPSTLIFLVLIAGVLLFLARFRTLGGAMIGLATLLFAILASPGVATELMRTLEHNSVPRGLELQPTAIVILTGYARADHALPITGKLNDASAFRVLEASRLLSLQALPVYISGHGHVPGLLADALRAVRTEPVTVHLDTGAMNTHDSAVNLKTRLGSTPFYLVTSAGHMPRSLKVFATQGMFPIPAPTDFYTSREDISLELLPSANALTMSDLAIHERAGILWYRLRGWIADSGSPDNVSSANN